MIDTTTQAQRIAELTERLQPLNIVATMLWASLTLMVIEYMQSVAVSGTKSFFTNYTNKLEPILSDDYKTEVLALDKRKYMAVLKWYLKMGAITQADIDRAIELRALRNKIAHELVSLFAMPDAEKDVRAIDDAMAILKKLDVFWARVNFEGEVPDEHLKEAMSGGTAMIHLALDALLKSTDKNKDGIT